MITPNPGWRGDPTYLPDLLRTFGVAVEEYPGWRDRGHGDFGKLHGIICHHTGSNNTPASYIAKHPQLGLCSQIHLARDGVATICGAGIAWHGGMGSWPGWPTNAANQVSVGIEAQSDGKTPWPGAQMDAYYRICAAICWFNGITSARAIGHKEWAGPAQGKWDPGLIDMDDFRRHVQHYIENPPFMKEWKKMADFDQITRRYTSRVPGSKVTMTPIDMLLNTDSHSWQTLQEVRQLRDEVRQLTATVAELKGAK